ncbi:DNA gyrase subunit A [Atopomonas sediminilitoris]|uniref:DNA gyrase subunit A n=1 Tax=Atopomonas sediminilitoris TaxID=2919919 RepID=UPI001F4DFF9F|nr:DNA gyrase subunit A [Atopomonas sediminilitoris]MCJ8169249.1 DNA gyrase subunit A [Atopomonas sediminilitoris]
MGELAKEILPVNIEDELKQSYLDYAMSVIVGRALPDVRDGLKPVHRRVLFAMSELKNDWNKPYKKSARVVGDVIGKYHPHGDSAVYDTIVRMAQPFSLRYMLVDGQGNFGSIDGDSAAAMRYTEVRMAKIAHEILADLEKETVDWVPNYDGTEQIPAVMPTKVPNLLVNGSSGIAVGMATNIPPHNLREVIDGCLALINNPELGVDDLMQFIPGPDFPTAGIINGRAGIIEAYRTGRGRVYMRARAGFEDIDKGGRQQIVITELPYQLNKARLIEKIAELVKEKKIEGISELRDESDKDGLRVVIELRRGEVAEVVLNNLYAQTQLQSVFGINMVALVDGQPRLLNLKDMLEAFVRHRREVVTRRTVYELRKARERGHILEGQAVALSNIDPVIELIKKSPTSAEAKIALVEKGWDAGAVVHMVERAGAQSCRPEDLDEQYGMRDGKYYLSPEQAQAILDLRLHRLTGLEHEKLLAEYQEILNQIGELLLILNSAERLMEVIREELEQVKTEYGDDRRSEIVASQMDLSIADLIPQEERVVTISHGGYAKTQPLSVYQAQRRGGRGKSATGVKDEDYIEHLLVANSHATLLLFSSKGKVYWLRTFEIPEASRTARGRPLVNLLPLDENERITAMLEIDLEALQASAGADEELDDNDAAVIEGEVLEADEGDDAADDADDSLDEATGAYIFMATAYGTVKKTPLVQFSKPRSSGLIALRLEEGDTLIAAAITDGAKEVMLFSDGGKVIRFKEGHVRTMGRTARGVRGMRLPEGQQLISMLIPESGAQILTASIRGYGKRTALEEFPRRGRGGQGVIAMVSNERNGILVAAVQVQEGEEIMLISDQGTLVRTRVDEVSSLGRNTQGVTLIKLASDESLVGLERVQEPSIDEDELLEEIDGEDGAEVEAVVQADDAVADE